MMNALGAATLKKPRTGGAAAPHCLIGLPARKGDPGAIGRFGEENGCADGPIRDAAPASDSRARAPPVLSQQGPGGTVDAPEAPPARQKGGMPAQAPARGTGGHARPAATPPQAAAEVAPGMPTPTCTIAAGHRRYTGSARNHATELGAADTPKAVPSEHAVRIQKVRHLVGILAREGPP